MENRNNNQHPYDSAFEPEELDWEKIIAETLAEEIPVEISPAPQEPTAPEQIPEVTPEPEDTAEDGTVPRKVRPKKKNVYGLFGLPHFISTVIWLAICLVVGVSLGRLVWVCATDLLAFGRHDQSVTVTISATDDLDSITDKLHNAGLIKYPGLFKLYCQLAQVEEKEKISVGTFELNTLYDYHALVGGMSATSSYRETIKVMIPEGYTSMQIFALLEEKGVCSVAALEKYSMESDFSDYWFLEGVERGRKNVLEGFLFPDTYEFYTNDTPQRVFIKFLNRFDDQFTDDMRNQLKTLNENRSLQFTVADLVTVASMVEKESAHSGESVDIAGVIYNRLGSSSYPFLNIDATVVYALGGKTDLTSEDLQIDDPYNTYKYKGLPPGPISNPGQLSLKAALSPADSNYYFYALDPASDSREHKFFRTYQEHLNFINGNK